MTAQPRSPAHPSSNGVPPIDKWFYPVGKPKPMPTQEHLRALLLLYQILLRFLPDEHLVGGAMVFMYDPLSLRKHYMPDLLVALRVGPEDPRFGGTRLQYRLWDEGKPPDIIVEAASESTVEKDNEEKRAQYARLGVREYVQFDPAGNLLQPRLQVFRLPDMSRPKEGGDIRYEPAPMEQDGAVWSSVLPCAWVMAGNMLRLRERATGQLLPTPEEAALAERDALAQQRKEVVAERDALTQQRDTVAAERDEAQEELARLRAELARLRGEES